MDEYAEDLPGLDALPIEVQELLAAERAYRRQYAPLDSKYGFNSER